MRISGTGETQAHMAPAMNGTTPASRVHPRHSTSHSPPATISPNAACGIAGASVTPPGSVAVHSASAIKSDSVHLTSSHTGPASPSGSSSRSEEHTSELQSLMRISYAVFCLKKKIHNNTHHTE